jgi:hypothetical protein
VPEQGIDEALLREVPGVDERPPRLAAQQVEPDAPGIHPLGLTGDRLVA